MVPYRYEEVSQRFADDLSRSLLGGESVILLSPRFIGKTYLASHVRNRLRENSEVGPIVDVRWLRDQPVGTRKQAVSVINEAVLQAAGRAGLELSPGHDLFDAIDELHAKAGKRIVLLAANVDAMGHHLARAFLQEVQKRVDAGTMTVLLGGEEDFRDMVRGPNSDFRCASLFVLQRVARNEFSAFFHRHAQAMRIEFDCEESACDYFFELTGGHTYLLRMALWQVTENRALYERSLPERIKIEDLDHLLAPNEVGSVRHSEPLLYATRIIAREPECWGSLQTLMREHVLEPDFLGNQPSTLELAGVAVFDDGRLRFSSKIMEDFITRHYDERRFGDLYARHGQWTEAFKRYARLPDEMYLRPSGVEDRLDMEFTVAALCTALRSAATQSSSAVMTLFEDGCRYLLALQVGEFRRPPYSKRWQADQTAIATISGPVVGIEAALTGIALVQPGMVPLPGPWSDYLLAAFLPALRTDELAAVAVGNLDGSSTISREQRRLARELLQHFVDAYSFAVATERDRQRSEVRRQHEEIIGAIFQSLGISVLDVGQALAIAAAGLRRMGYQRVSFSLVDPKGERIKGVLDDSDEPSVDIAALTNWPLDDPVRDLQPYVVRTGQPKIIPDAALEPLANKEVVKQARMKAAAIVPIINARGVVIGTIHVARQDGEVPSWDEVDDLMAFGRRLAVAIEQSQRVNLLQSAIDQGPSPVVILDARNCLRYANKPAAELFNLPSGWCSESDSLPSSAALAETETLFHDALDKQHRQFHHLPCISNKSDSGAAVLADVIWDWRKEVVGGVVHVQYLRDLTGVLTACEIIARAHDTESAMRAILDATSTLGHKWGRLYLLSEDEPSRLIGKQAFGFGDPIINEAFAAGKVVLLPQNEPDQESWLCIERREPCVFAWKEEYPNGSTFQTSQGLTVLKLSEAKCPQLVKKQQDEFWIDFPLFTREKVLGKITLQCDETMPPEEYELLRVLSRLTSSLLDAFSERDEVFRRQADYIRRDVAEKTLATAAHNINTRLAGLSALLARYELHEGRYGPLRALDSDFEHVLHETLGTTSSIKQRLSPVHLRVERFDLVKRLARALATTLPQASWELHADPPSQEVQADGHLLETAFLEILDNSVQAVGCREDVRLRVDVHEGAIAGAPAVCVSVVDNGPGVPCDLKETIFNDFFSQRPGRKVGLGLGLGFVRRVIRAHGGTIRENGVPDGGAQFLIEIPRGTLLEYDEMEQLQCTDS